MNDENFKDEMPVDPTVSRSGSLRNIMNRQGSARSLSSSQQQQQRRRSSSSAQRRTRTNSQTQQSTSSQSSSQPSTDSDNSHGSYNETTTKSNKNANKFDESSTTVSSTGASSTGGADSPLPDGWTVLFDHSSGQPYYYNSVENYTTWERPLTGNHQYVTIESQQEMKEVKALQPAQQDTKKEQETPPRSRKVQFDQSESYNDEEEATNVEGQEERKVNRRKNLHRTQSGSWGNHIIDRAYYNEKDEEPITVKEALLCILSEMVPMPRDYWVCDAFDGPLYPPFVNFHVLRVAEVVSGIGMGIAAILELFALFYPEFDRILRITSCVFVFSSFNSRVKQSIRLPDFTVYRKIALRIFGPEFIPIDSWARRAQMALFAFETIFLFDPLVDYIVVNLLELDQDVSKIFLVAFRTFLTGFFLSMAYTGFCPVWSFTGLFVRTKVIPRPENKLSPKLRENMPDESHFYVKQHCGRYLLKLRYGYLGPMVDTTPLLPRPNSANQPSSTGRCSPQNDDKDDTRRSSF